MQILLVISNYTILACFKKSTIALEQWISTSGAYISEISDELISDELIRQVDLKLDIEMFSGQFDLNTKDNLEFEYSNGVLESVQINKPSLMGKVYQKLNKFYGNLKTSGDYPELIDFLLSTCLSVVCEERGDLLLHSSAVIMDNRAWLFVGDSGAGKTTIALELNAGATPMSVDRTVVSMDKTGCFYAHSTSFSDRNGDIKEARSAKLAGLVFVEQAKKHEIIAISSWEVTTLLLRQTLAASRNKTAVSKVLSGAGRLAENVFCCKMKFEKNDKFWRLLKEEATK